MVLELAPRIRLDVAPDHTHQRTCDMEHADAVGEARMGCARENELRESKLPNAAQALERFDRNKDGMLDREELLTPKKKLQGRPGEIITPAAKGERSADKLKVGDPAPAFTLPLVNGKGEVALAAFKEKKPVVLIFASYT